MRSRHALIAVAMLLPLTGCNLLRGNIFGSKNKDVAINEEKPTKEKLVAYLNNEANRLNSLQVTNLGIEAKMGFGAVRSIGLGGYMCAKKPRNFRLEGHLSGMPTDIVDIGSNDREFWFWVGGAARDSESPYLYHCSHTDLPRAQLPLPIHPDWIMEALGMAPVSDGPGTRMEFRGDGRYIELIEATRSPAGQPMQKVTVFNARTVSGTQPQVVARKLVDARGKVICVAEIHEMQTDPHSDPNNPIKVPYKMSLIYPSERRMEQIQLNLVLDTIAVNKPMDEELARHWFTRPVKPGVIALDLGRQNPNSSLRLAPGSPTGGNSPIFRGARLK